MKRGFILPTLAVCGILGLAFSLVHNRSSGGETLPSIQSPPAAPYGSYLAASGIIEASTRNIAIATPTAGTVAQVAVHVGQAVKVQQVLFMLDDRDLRANLKVRKATLEANRSRLLEAYAARGDAEEQFHLAESISDRRAISAEDLSKRQYAMLLARAREATARADVETARDQIDEVLTQIERETIRSPIDGVVLQVNVEPGEFAPTGVLAVPLLVLGGTDRLHLRIDIDEADAWRFHAGAQARAYVRGNRSLTADLRFEYIEPYVVPKVSLTGDTAQRVDTRTLQVIYSFVPGTLPVYVGQQVDVFVDTSTIAPRPRPQNRDGV